MQVNSSISLNDFYKQYILEQTQQTQSTGNDVANVQTRMQQSVSKYSSNSFLVQSSTTQQTQIDANTQEFQKFLKDIGYNGKNIAQLSQDEAKQLVSEDGFFGVSKTAQRIADFVINGAGSNENLLRAGRSGILEGFNQVQKIWGGKLPDIAQQTIDKASQLIDQKMSDLGYSVLNTTA